MVGKRVPAVASAVVALCLLVLAVYHQTGRVSLLDEHAANIKAVGDLGCLGRECQMTDAGSRHDMDKFFDKFLGKGSGHEGRKNSRFTPVHNKKIDTVSGVKDMQSYYSNLPGSKTKKVAEYEKNSLPNLQLKTDDSRDDMNKFYDSLSHGKRAKIVKSEKHAQHRSDRRRAHAETAAEAEDERMEQLHHANLIQAKEDHRRFKARAQQQLAVQAAGHDMQAVPSNPRTDESERQAENAYFHKLQHKAKSQRAKDAARHPSREATAPVVSGKLSAKDSQEDMERWYSKLDKKVHKTARILVAEEEARKDKMKLSSNVPSEDKEAEEDAKSAKAAVPTFKTKHSARLSEEDMDSYYAELNSKVHKTQKVIEAEQEAEHGYNTIKAKSAMVHQKSQKAAKAAKQAVETTKIRVSGSTARSQLDSYFASLAKGARKTGIVLATEREAEAQAKQIKKQARKQDAQAEERAKGAAPAVGDKPLSAKEARDELVGGAETSEGRKLRKSVEAGIQEAHVPNSATGADDKAAWMKELKTKALEAKGAQGTEQELNSEWAQKKGKIVKEFVHDHRAKA
mmetsp:Transcript_29521/g.46313  ORF Transcript_29521/g.46313 Transcript_29521/m.46313 type:complete len:569 (+) Transcript_29521:30-1736(+)